MIVISCTHENQVRCGKDRKGNQRLMCKDCGKYLSAPKVRPLGDMRISMRQATTAIGMLLEGMSIRAVERLTGLHRDTIDSLILVVGENCQRLMNTIKAVKVEDVQVDELWSFIGLKERNRAARGYSAEFGDSWCFIGIESTTKMVLAYHIGQRDGATCWDFLLKLNEATSGSFQLTTDGLPAYKSVPYVFGSRVRFAQLIKTYTSTQEVTRYSPAKIKSIEKRPLFGDCEDDRISTSYIERLNLTIRMQLRRFTRLTNAHSKSPKHHAAMQGLFFAHYNWCRKHETLKGKTPAMSSGLTDSVWTLRELLERSAAA